MVDQPAGIIKWQFLKDYKSLFLHRQLLSLNLIPIKFLFIFFI